MTRPVRYPHSARHDAPDRPDARCGPRSPVTAANSHRRPWLHPLNEAVPQAPGDPAPGGTPKRRHAPAATQREPRARGGENHDARAEAGRGPGRPAAGDRHRHERHAGPVDEVRVGGRVEQDGVGAGADAEVADVVAPQRARRRPASPRPAPRRPSSACRARRARCRTPSTSCSSSRDCSSSRSRRARPRRSRGARRDRAGGWRSRSPAGTSRRCPSRRARRCRRRTRYVQ